MPKKPLNAKVLKRDSVAIDWETPEDDGGSPITGYLVERREPTCLSWIRAEKMMSTDTFTKITDLVYGNEYFFRVAAFNAVGTGEFLEMDSPVKMKSPYGMFLIVFHLKKIKR